MSGAARPSRSTDPPSIRTSDVPDHKSPYFGAGDAELRGAAGRDAGEPEPHREPEPGVQGPGDTDGGDAGPSDTPLGADGRGS